jgi:EPS-associated MarR family transcriptional regulator
VLDDEVRYKLFKLLEANPGMPQREVARELGVSVGKVNYCIRALIDKGWVKAANFRNSRNKAAYAYLLTPRGIEEKANLTMSFLQTKLSEYERLRVDIEAIRAEVRRGQQPK